MFFNHTVQNLKKTLIELDVAILVAFYLDRVSRVFSMGKIFFSLAVLLILL